MEDSSIQVAVNGDTAYVRICGKGSFKNSPSLKRFLAHVREQSCSSVIFDMRECITMDSTFMGVLAGSAVSLRGCQTPMRLVNLSEKNMELLSTLGLKHLMELVSEAETAADAIPAAGTAPSFENVPTVATDKKESAEIMLDAHKTLVEIEPSNEARFEDVIEFLKDSLADGGGPA